ncbi:MAG: GSCFA domain-containing protein, partial [Chitinophagaceae bacterium]
MKFRLEMLVPKFPFAISHKDSLFLIGSCFTENMGEKLRQALFTTTENPHGILFNPYSVHKALSDYIHKNRYTEDHLFYHGEAWHSWHHHSRFSAATPEESVERINTAIAHAHERLLHSKYLIITLGSAWVYSLTKEATVTPNTTIVANNHKAPAQWFTKKLMESEEIVVLYQKLFRELQAINPTLQIILTVSPVRHLREGTVMNNLSKAHLLAAVHKL